MGLEYVMIHCCVDNVQLNIITFPWRAILDFAVVNKSFQNFSAVVCLLHVWMGTFH